jgi:DNA helicase-2/ATP-dependent DNA helicase PcrA
MSVNNYNFPSSQSHDRFISEKWYVRDGLNLEMEALAQLKAVVSEGVSTVEGQATLDARLEYASERLRLLYVGITRARKALTITFNSGRRGNQVPATPVVALRTFWEQRESDVGTHG